MEDPKFSVIIPCYNPSETFVDTLKSVSNQVWPAHEVIVIDDCSTKDVQSTIDRIQMRPELKYIRLKSNSGGPARPRNTGISYASGDYVAFLDADDLWRQNHLQVLAAIIAKTSADLVVAKLADFDSEQAMIRNRKKQFAVGQPSHHRINPILGYMKCEIPTSATAVRRKLFDEFKFNESRKFSAVEDGDLWLRLFAANKHCEKVSCITVDYRNEGTGISSNKFVHLRKIFMIQVVNHKAIFDRDFRRKTIGIFVNPVIAFCAYCIRGFYLRKIRKEL